MAEIRLENVTRVFRGARSGIVSAMEETERTGSGAIRALDGLTLTVPEGRTVAVIGPSGCGKSTLLRVVAGLDQEYEGTVAYDGRDMRDVPPRDRYIGMVFQNYALYPHFYGHGNLSFYFRMRKAPDQEAEARIRETADIMGYGFRQLLGRKPGTLSGGEQQRLAIARAIVRKPALFLFDEPLSSLDAKLRAQTRVEIRRLLRRFAITSIYVTHDQVEAIALADVIAVMRAGKIEQAGAYAELRANPANTFVAGFLGLYPINLLQGRVTGVGTAAVGLMETPLPGAVQAKCVGGDDIVLGVAAEDLALDYSDRHELAPNALHGRIASIEPDFARHSQYVRVDTPAGQITVAEPSNEPLAISQPLAVYLRENRVHYFDAKTGRNLLA